MKSNEHDGQAMTLFDDDFILLLDDEQEEKVNKGTWKILVVDDEESIHKITKIILKDFEFEHKVLEIFDSYSDENARIIIQENPDIAVILLDVVMKEDDSGLKFIQYVRDELKNKIVRIILRTGQPGQAPERKVIIDYDINDYKLKSEITANKLFVSVLTALRSYRDLIDLEDSKNGLEKIIQSSAGIYRHQSFKNLISSVLIMLNSLLKISKNIDNGISSMEASKKSEAFFVEAAIGDYEKFIGHKLDDVLPLEALNSIKKSIQNNEAIFDDQYFSAYFKSSLGNENIIFTKNNKDYNQLEQSLTEIFCSNIAVAFDNFYLKEEINSTQKEIIYTLGEIAESKSSETGHHVKRVAKFSKLIALEVGLPEDESEVVSIASTMHDVGKLIISDAILNKPGKLTKEEFEHIKTHTSIGYNMLKKSNGKVIKIASIIALQHHEKYNGSGYPEGVSGENINLYARIVAVADVFDALISKRVYKDAWEIKEIIDLFNNEKGKHFDPILANILLKNIDQMIHIKNSFPD